MWRGELCPPKHVEALPPVPVNVASLGGGALQVGHQHPRERSAAGVHRGDSPGQQRPQPLPAKDAGPADTDSSLHNCKRVTFCSLKHSCGHGSHRKLTFCKISEKEV